MVTKTVVLTAFNSVWVVPSDFGPTNYIEAIGSGSYGGGGSYSTGGHGGGYARVDNLSLTPGASIPISIGSGGGPTWFQSTAILQAAGGSSGSNIGATHAYPGGSGAGGSPLFGGGGGGAAGPLGNGGNAGGASQYTGGNGGASAGGGASGGGGGSTYSGAGGGGRTAWWTDTATGSTFGPGSGGGGGGSLGAGNGAVYGGGGGAGRTSGAQGGQGLIAITYTPVTASIYTLTGDTGSVEQSGAPLSRASFGHKLAVSAGAFAEALNPPQKIKAKRQLPGDTGLFALASVASARTSQGTHMPLSPVSFAALGGRIAVDHGKHTSAGILGLSGNAANFGKQLPIATAFHALSGAVSTLKLQWKLTLATGAFVRAGEAAQIGHGRALKGVTASFARSAHTAKFGFGLPAQTIAISERLSGPGFASPGKKSYTAAVASIALGGKSAEAKIGYQLSAETGAFAGLDDNPFTDLSYGFRMAGVTGSFAKIGDAAAFPKYAPVTPRGAFAIFGSDATLTIPTVRLSPAPGFIGISGISAKLTFEAGFHNPAGVFGIRGHDATFSQGFAYIGDTPESRVLIPNDRFPVDLLLFRVLGNVEVAGFVESTLADPNNMQLAWSGPFPPAGRAVKYTRPKKPTGLIPTVTLFD